MNIQEIERLIEKYFNGETSISEEIQLQDFFANREIPEHLTDLKPLFDFSFDEKSIRINDPAFDTNILNRIKKEHKTEIKFKKRLQFYAWSGIAAAVIITVSSLLYTPPVSQMESTNDPEIAYREISNALLHVAIQLNKGLQPVKTSSGQFDRALKPVQKLTELDQTIHKIGNLGTQM